MQYLVKRATVLSSRKSLAALIRLMIVGFASTSGNDTHFSGDRLGLSGLVHKPGQGIA
jgi:hypothetical protein